MKSILSIFFICFTLTLIKNVKCGSKCRELVSVAQKRLQSSHFEPEMKNQCPLDLFRTCKRFLEKKHQMPMMLLFVKICFQSQEQSKKNQQPLIPRKVLFDSKKPRYFMLSPDGTKIAFLSPWNSIDNIWIVSTDSPIENATPVTYETTPIKGYVWTYMTNVIIFSQDTDGNENFYLHKLNIDEPGRRPTILSSRNANSDVKSMNHRQPEKIIFMTNERYPRFFDAYFLDLKTNKKTLIFKNDRFGTLHFDNNFQLGLVTEENDKGGKVYYQVESDWSNGNQSSYKYSIYKTVTLENSMATMLLGFDKTNSRTYWLDNTNSDLNSLYLVDWVNPDCKQLLHEADQNDIQSVRFHPTKLTPLAVYYANYQKAIDPSIINDMRYLNKLEQRGYPLISMTSHDFKIWLVVWIADDRPSSYYIYKRSLGKAVPFFKQTVLNDQFTLAKMRSVTVQTRDGYSQFCYLTIPHEFVTNSTNGPLTTKPLSMVLQVHGGPSISDIWAYTTNNQFLANRGYAVLQCNYRGSTRYGKRWYMASKREWGRKMHYDLIDAVQWAIQSKVAKPDKIAVSGGSYGGYAALVGLTFTPDVFACGIDMVGPSNLITLLNSTPPHWKSYHAKMQQMIGNWQTQQGQRFLRTRSPFFFAHRIKKPLLIAHGANDPRVKKRESDMIVDALKKHNIPVTYLLFPDEGHGFRKSENIMAYQAVYEHFLKQCLGGRAEPIGGEFNKSTIQIMEKGNLVL